MTIVIGLALALVTLFAGIAFFGVPKKRRALAKRMNDQQFLDTFLKRVNEEKSLEIRTKELQPIGETYYELLARLAVLESAADNRLRYAGLIVWLIVVAVSIFIGFTFLIANVALFAISAAIPIGESADKQAFLTILRVAMVIYKWNKEKPEECANYLADRPALQRIHEAITELVS